MDCRTYIQRALHRCSSGIGLPGNLQHEHRAKTAARLARLPGAGSRLACKGGAAGYLAKSQCACHRDSCRPAPDDDDVFVRIIGRGVPFLRVHGQAFVIINPFKGREVAAVVVVVPRPEKPASTIASSGRAYLACGRVHCNPLGCGNNRAGVHEQLHSNVACATSYGHKRVQTHASS